MPLESVSAEKAKALADGGAILVDVREASEHAREHIVGSALLPLSQIKQEALPAQAAQPVIFYCQSGARTASSAGILAAKAGQSRTAYVMSGGIVAWKRAGMPTSAGSTGSKRGVDARGLIVGAAIVGAIVWLWFTRG